MLTGNRARADAANILGLMNTAEGGVQLRTAEAMFALLRNRTPAEIAAIRTEYNAMVEANRFDSDIMFYFTAYPDIFGTANNNSDYAVALLNGDRVTIAERALHLAMDRPGTDEHLVWNTLTGLWADERARVAQVYRASHDKSLLAAFAEEFEDSSIYGNEYSKTIRIFSHGGLTLAERIYYAVQGWGTSDPELQAALAELRTMTPEQIAVVDQAYQGLSGGESMRNGVLGDLSGRERMIADIGLRGRAPNIQTEALRLVEEHDWEMNGWTTYAYLYYSDGINGHYSNQELVFQRLQSARQAYATNPTAENEQALRQAIDDYRQALQTFQEARDATADIVANSLATAAGIAVVIGTGGIASPLVIAIAATAGGATQVLTRLGISDTFNWEQMPSDFVLGAVNAGTAALSFPAAVREAILNGSAQVGVLRQIAGSAFFGGASASAVATGFNDATWQDGFAPGLVNIGQASLIGGFTSTAIPATIGAGLFLARGALPFASRLLTTTGTTVTNLFDSSWVRVGVNAIREGTQTIRGYLESTLIGWAGKADEIAQRLISAAPTESEAATRQALREILASTNWNQIQRDFIEDTAINALRAHRAELNALGVSGTRELLENSARGSMNMMNDTLDALKNHITITGHLAGGISDTQIDALARRLAALENIDDAGIRAALQAPDVLGSAAAIPDGLVRALREFVENSRLSIDCSTWARQFATQNGGTVMHLKPKVTPGTGYLPGELPPWGGYQYHSVVIRNGMLFDELHPNGISFDSWKQQFLALNNLTEAEFGQLFDFDAVPHPNAVTQ